MALRINLCSKSVPCFAFFLALTALLCLPACCRSACAQAEQPVAPVAAATAPAAPAASPTFHVSAHDLKQADRHYRRGRKFFKQGKLDRAEDEYAAAAQLSPGNSTYLAERELTRTKFVGQLVETAQADRQQGNHAAAQQALGRAHELDPQNDMVDAQVRAESDLTDPVVVPSGGLAHIESGVVQLQLTPGKQSLSYRGGGQELVRQTFQKFGITATLDDSVPNQLVRAGTEELDFAHAIQTVLLLTNSFYVALDPHRVLVAKDTTENRAKFERQFVETAYMPGLSQTELQDAANVAKQILNVKQITTNAGDGTISIRAPQQTLETFNNVLTDLYQGRSQVLLKLSLYQITQTKERVTGVQLPSSITLFNVPAEIALLYAQYSTVIAQLIASGLVSANNPLEILAALIASGQITSGPGSEPFRTIGGGLTQFGVAPNSGASANASINSSDVRQLDQVQLRIGNQETATFRNGTRYPIITSSYSSVGISAAALGTAGTNIMQLLAANGISASSLANTQTTPNIQYEDLGLTVKATPTIQKSGDVSLKLEMKISALAGAALNNVPILINREFDTTIAVKEGDASIVTSNLSRQESKALTGIPGLNDIPGFPATNVDHTVDTSQLVLVLVPHVVRLEHPYGRGKLILLPRH